MVNSYKLHRETKYQHRLDMYPKIDPRSLTHNLYSISTLEYNMKSYKNNKIGFNRIGLRRLINTQILDLSFCMNFIFNDDYIHSDDESYITILSITNNQPHIKYKELSKLVKSHNN